jgi:hypothetical protein
VSLACLWHRAHTDRWLTLTDAVLVPSMPLRSFNKYQVKVTWRHRTACQENHHFIIRLFCISWVMLYSCFISQFTSIGHCEQQDTIAPLHELGKRLRSSPELISVFILHCPWSKQHCHHQSPAPTGFSIGVRPRSLCSAVIVFSPNSRVKTRHFWWSVAESN